MTTPPGLSHTVGQSCPQWLFRAPRAQSFGQPAWQRFPRGGIFGYLITEINGEPGNEFIQFNNGKTLTLGQELGGIRDDLWRVQIRNTIRRHLDKEIALKDKGIKVLSLFFIDKVANYRSYDEQGQPVKGKFAIAFEEAFKELTAQEKYKGLAIPERRR